MNFIQNWSGTTLEALEGLWQGFLEFIPKLIGAIIVFVIGWIVAVWIGKLVTEILKRLKFDKIFEQTKWQETLEKAEFKMSMSNFIGGIVKWILVIVFLMAAVQILGMGQFAAFLGDVVSWLPNLVVAAAIFVVSVIIADIAEKLIRAVAGKINLKSANMAGSITRWAIWIFAALAILGQLGVAPRIIEILITGFVALIVISASLALGLGGKDLARDALAKFRNRLNG